MEYNKALIEQLIEDGEVDPTESFLRLIKINDELVEALKSAKNYFDTRFEPEDADARATLLYMQTIINQALSKAGAK